MQHFIDIHDITREQLLQLLSSAQYFFKHNLIAEKPVLTNATVANLFFEPSTRTQASFEIAAKKLGAHVLSLNVANSSTTKGESVEDTVLTLQAMGVDIFVLRHQDNVMLKLAAMLKDKAHLVNAGEGQHQHPSQAVLDMLTIQQHDPHFEKLSVAIVGDILHSRVARSSIAALQLLGCRDIRVIAPQNLFPQDLKNVHHETDMQQGLKNADVVMMLRIQKERMHDKLDQQDYIANYQLTSKKLALAKPNAIVMHPGPMNREVEITSDVADGSQSKILQQVRNGVAARMAILAALQEKVDGC